MKVLGIIGGIEPESTIGFSYFQKSSDAIRLTELSLQARALDLPLLTYDQGIRKSGLVKTWKPR